jgi:hypothetical protein
VVINAVINLANIVTGGSGWPSIVNVVLTLLFIFGLPAIWERQPQTGRLGQMGLWCLGIAAGIALVVQLVFLASARGMNSLIPWSSALLFLAGAILVGRLTVRARVFPAALGWLLMLAGVANLVGGLTPDGLATTIVGITSMLAQTAAFAGYGWIIVRRSTSVRAHPGVGVRAIRP